MKSFKQFFVESVESETATEIGTDENIENAFKKLFVKEGEFIWLDEPLYFVEGKIKVLILAYKPLPTNVFYWYEKPSSIPDEIESSQVFYKKVDYVSNKLMKTSTFTLRGGSSSYGMAAPTLDPHATKFNNGTITQLGIEYNNTAINTTKALDTIYKQTQNLKKLEEVRDVMDYFDLINNVREQGNIKIVPVNNDNFYKITHIPNNITEDVNAFNNYIFEGGVKMTCIVNNQAVFPKEVKGDKCLVILDSSVDRLNGFPKLSRDCEVEISGPVKSYAGLPREFNCIHVHVKNNSSLTNFPKIINGNCELSNIDSFKGGEDTVINGTLTISKGRPTSYRYIPQAKDYLGFADHAAEVKKIEEVIRSRRYVDKKLSSDWNVDLDDFS